MKNLKKSKVKSQLALFFSIIILFSVLISCKKDEKTSNEITYDLTGNFGKTVVVKYTPTNGTIANTEEMVTLPWQKVVVPNAENSSVGLVVTGDNGIPGANVTAKVFVNGVEARRVDMQADASGDFVITINHIF